MSEYDSIVTNENTNENTSDIENNIDKTKKDKYNYNDIKYCIIFILVIYGIYWIYFWDMITISINTNFDNVDNNDLTAGLPFHRNHHHITCDDFEYGCCEVIDNKNKKHTLSLHRIVKNDVEGSNCPSFNTLINKYIEYIKEYYSDLIVDCNLTECCKKYDIIIQTKKCPSSYEIVYEYNDDYSDPNIGLYILLILFIFVLCIIIKEVIVYLENKCRK